MKFVFKLNWKPISEIEIADQSTFQSSMTNFAHIQEALIKFLRSIWKVKSNDHDHASGCDK